jgi:GntR family transcriptional regulator
VSLLEREGLIVSFRGRGTFVAHDRLRKAQDELRSFTEEVLSRGGVPESRVLSFRQAEASEEARTVFSLSAGEPVYEIRRLRLKDRVPLAIEVVQLPRRLCPGLDGVDLERNSLYRTLEQSYGLRLKTCVEEISARSPSPEERKLLEIPRSAAVLVIARTSYTPAGEPCELARAVYRGDMYSAVVHSARKERE